ncbi:MAG TPA: acireductone synthase [Candidatus Acidoferrum sp.]|nr:acireductone synthase [Candidatus Acidoferrum sp.]
MNLPALPKTSSVFCFLLDIEGTTTPVDFVYKTLFPFAAERVDGFLRRHIPEAETVSLLEDLRQAHAAEWTDHPAIGPWLRRTPEEEIASATKYVRHLIAVDRKVRPLKTLQGKIWEEGYRSGNLLGEVYEDVPRAFARWRSDGKRIAIFSSGSILAQKLLFGHSNAGDLTKQIEAYFDTTTGPKREAKSYSAIAGALREKSGSVLFVSDVEAELDAAKEAGMQTALMIRPGAAEATNARHATIKSFDEP